MFGWEVAAVCLQCVFGQTSLHEQVVEPSLDRFLWQLIRLDPLRDAASFHRIRCLSGVPDPP